MRSQKKALTLLELLIAVALISVITLGLGSIIVFSSFQTTSSSRRQQAQNEVFVALEHMNKLVPRAIGNEIMSEPSYGDDTVVLWGDIGGDPALRVYIDSNAAGGEGDGEKDTAGGDHWIAYRLKTGNPNEDCLLFCPTCNNVACNGCPGVGWANTEIVGRNITNFNVTKPGDPGSLTENNITVSITGCWDTNQPASVTDNPCITMTERIIMPSVSTN